MTLANIIIDSLDTKTVLGILTLAGVALTAIYAYLGKTNATQANSAVNHRPKGDPTLYQLVKSIDRRVEKIDARVERLTEKVDEVEAFRDGYAGSALPNGAAVQRLVDQVEQCVEGLAQIRGDFVRYGCPVKTGERAEHPADCTKHGAG